MGCGVDLAVLFVIAVGAAVTERTPWPCVEQKSPTFHLFFTVALRIRILFSVSRWSEERETVLVPEFLLGVGVADVAAKSLVSVVLIYAYCCVVATASWSSAAYLVEDAAAMAPNWPSSISRNPCVYPHPAKMLAQEPAPSPPTSVRWKRGF